MEKLEEFIKRADDASKQEMSKMKGDLDSKLEELISYKKQQEED